MPKVTVDHTGMTDGHYYTKDVPVELPADVVEALGDTATPFESESQAKRVAVQKKEVKNVKNKMVQKADATTKEPEAPAAPEGDADAKGEGDETPEGEKSPESAE